MKIIKTIFLTLIILSLSATTAFAWDDCPYGEIDCGGKCGLFVDTDSDEICDHSQLAPEDRNIDLRISDTSTNNAETLNTETTDAKNQQTYHLIPITALLILLYFISFVLSKKKIISLMRHRMLWNMLLLITFLISAILGILLVIKINFSLAMPLPFNPVFWHVEIGIAMAVISIFHILWHWAYFKSIFRIKKKQ